jgi:hypothetical protein
MGMSEALLERLMRFETMKGLTLQMVTYRYKSFSYGYGNSMGHWFHMWNEGKNDFVEFKSQNEEELWWKVFEHLNKVANPVPSGESPLKKKEA